MTARQRSGKVLLILCALGATPAAHALFGVGDITYDPTVYAEVLKLYEQGKELYKTTMDQLDRLDKMQRTITEAHQAYDRLVNLNLHKIAEDLKPGKYMKYDNSENRFRMMRAELSHLRYGVESNVDFVRGQLGRIDALETMVGMQDAAARNAQTAAKDLDARTSGQITAQSTATLSALAAAEEQRRQQQDMAQASEQQRQSDLLSDSANLYRAIGGNDASESSP
jgi:hypothetical protein